MGLKVCIVGLAPSSRNLAPFDDPEWEVWGLPWDRQNWCRFNRLFDMHDPEYIKTYQKDEYFERLRSVDVPLYMPRKSEEVPNAVPFPLAEVIENLGCDYFSSSLAYMAGMALLENVEELSVFGVDMAAQSEYAYQRPNLEYILGIAVGRGVKVNIPWQSPLCKYSRFDRFLTRYGYVDNHV